MTLNETIFGIISNFQPLVDLVGDNIYYEKTPDNFDFRQDCLIYSSGKIDVNYDLSGDAWSSRYIVKFRSYSADSLKIFGILEEVEIVLTGPDQGTKGIKFTSIERDDPGFDTTIDAYLLEMEATLDFIGAIESVTPGEPPEALNVQILGAVKEFETVTGDYLYTDPEGQLESGSSYRWFISTNPNGFPRFAVPGATEQTLEIVNLSAGLFLAFEVTPRNNLGQVGDAVLSDFELIFENVVPEAQNVAFTGTLEVFNLLTGTYDYVDNDGDPELGTLYQWFTADDAGGTNQQQILGAVGQLLPLPLVAEGLFIAFGVTPRDDKGQFGDLTLSDFDGPIAGPVSDYSPEAQAVFDRMPDALATETKDRWAVFIDAEAINNNYFLNDDFLFFVDNFADSQPLTEANALTGWLQSQAINNGGVKVLTGFDFDGNQHVDSGFNPSSFGVADFNGTTSLVDFAEFIASDIIYTITGWMKLSSFDRNGLFVQNGPDFNPGNRKLELLTTIDGELQIAQFDAVNGNIGGKTPSLFGHENESLFFVCSYDGAKIFPRLEIWDTKNNLLFSLVESFDDTGYTVLNPADLGGVFGTLPGNVGAYQTEGNLWNYAQHDTVLTDQQIQDVRAGGLSGDEISAWRLDGVDFTDSVGANDGTPTDVTQAFIADPEQNYQLNDAIAGSFLAEFIDDTGDIAGLLGSSANANGNEGLQIRLRIGLWEGILNGSTSRPGLLPFLSGRYYIGDVESSGRGNVLEDGVIVGGGTRGTLNFPDVSFFIGANRATTNRFRPMNGTIANFIVGASNSFNHELHYTNFINFLFSLDVFAGPIIASYPVALQAKEADALRTYIHAEILDGNHGLKDSEAFFVFADEQNALWDSIRALSFTNNGAVHIVNQGFELGANASIDTNYNNTIDAINYKLDDCFGGGFMLRNDSTGDERTTILANGAGNRFELGQQLDNGRLQYYLNSSGRNVNAVPKFQNERQYLAFRTGPDFVRLDENGVEIDSSVNVPSAELRDENFVVSTLAPPLGIMSQIIIGGAIGFDSLAHYNNLIEFFIDLDVIAGPIIDAYPVGLPQSEIDGMRDYINAEVRAGNHQLKDSEAFFFLSSEANALFDSIRLSSMTNNGAVHVPGQSFEFSGTNQWIDTEWNPSVDGINYQLNDFLFGVWWTMLDDDGNQNVIGSSDGLLRIRESATQWRTQHNSLAQIFWNTGYHIINDELQIMTGDDAQAQHFLDGQLIQNVGNTPTDVPSVNIILGGDDGGVNNIECEIRTSIFGASIGFNQLAHYNNLIEFMIAVDVFAGPIIASYPVALTVAESDGMRIYINDEVRAGNHQLKDAEAFGFLSDSQNQLFDPIRQVAMVNNGAVISSGVGWVFDGAEWIDTLFDPSTDAINYKLESAVFGYMVVDKTNGDASLGGFSASTIRTRIYENFSSGWTQFAVNGSGNVIGLVELIQPDSLYVATGDGSNVRIYKNGNLEDSTASLSPNLPNSNWTIGADTGSVNFLTGTESYFFAGGGIGFDPEAHNQNLRTFIDSL